MAPRPAASVTARRRRRRRPRRAASVPAKAVEAAAAAAETARAEAAGGAQPPPSSPSSAPAPPRRDRPPRLRFPLLLLLLVGPAAGAPAPAPAPIPAPPFRTFIAVQEPPGLKNGCVNPISGGHMPGGAEWPDGNACQVLVCSKAEDGSPQVEIVGCAPPMPSANCIYRKAEGHDLTVFPNCCGQYICGGGISPRMLGDEPRAMPSVIYAV